ncbi:hypothetical protein [Streptomyces spiralis]|nr:hypothetical protein [Streptomyces spiralis]
MDQLAVDVADHGRIIDLRRDPDASARLPHGRANGRYRCLACGHRLPLIHSCWGPAGRNDTYGSALAHPGRSQGGQLLLTFAAWCRWGLTMCDRRGMPVV